MARLTRGHWLATIRELRNDLDNASAELEKWENYSRTLSDGFTDVDQYIARMHYVWQSKYEHIADCKKTLSSKRQLWNSLRKRALRGDDEALVLAWLEWMMEADKLSEGFDEIQAVLPDSFSARADLRVRAAMVRGGFRLTDEPSC